ncbi:hypothetical protein BS17DRAFT_769877 [Gyrodon lividus]|nr:hypothetical protein BS17DRAFT_769877 [Gyrodon lividus]
MAQERTWQTHVCFRSAYNLTYEAVMQECNLAIEMYEGKAKQRSYGVRDEYRLNGFATIDVLDNLEALTKHYLESQPMLWMSSATWFNFLARRFRELQKMQICLRHLQPPNMGVLTGIVCSMIHSIASTPIILDFHICKSMALLQFSQAIDNAEVMRLVDAKSGDRRIVSRKIWLVPSSSQEQEMFPIDTPWELMWAWMWDSHLAHLEPVVGKLFTDFTYQMWLFLHKHWLPDPSNVPAPSCLNEAMECWSVDGKVVGKPWVVNKQGKVQFITNPMFYKILGLSEAGAPIQRRTGPQAIKPIQEFTLDMLWMARDQKSTKAKRSQKPPLARKGVALQQVQEDSLIDAPLDHHDVSIKELFGPEDMDVSMDDVSGRKGQDHMVEDMIGPDDSDVSMEDATAGKDGEVDMADSSSGEEEGHLESLMGEEGSSDYDCQAED